MVPNANELDEMMKKSLFSYDEGAPKDGEFILVEGLTRKFGFHPTRVLEYRGRLKDYH